ncbi:MAG: hypothetical protein ACSHWW_08270 [Nonlabens sp.]|uniref:hypothetical protein n=1 Tax=Nonlabens sp. TaxID=1888209 RepID=UPI003EF54B7B
MKHLLKTSVILILLTTLTSCLGGSNAPENLNIDEDFKLFESTKFNIKVPDYLTETTDLNDDAEMQMQNMFRETYMIVMAESKSDFDFARRILDMGSDSLSYAENYMDMQLDSMEEAFDYNVTKPKMTHVINGMPAMTAEASARIDGMDIVYLITTVESEHDIFYATCWTLKNRKDKYFPSFYQSLETLTQLEYDLESEESEMDIDYEQLLKDLEIEE